MRTYGLIGQSLKHSFSKDYFSKKFAQEDITDARYELFELAEIIELPMLLQNTPQLAGLNVTIPYKSAVIPYLDVLDASAELVGAVNVIAVAADGRKIGYNSDYYGFLQSLQNWEAFHSEHQALILGNGGAAKAVVAALKTLGITYRLVSRQPQAETLSYTQLATWPDFERYTLLINTTPLGMYPHTDTCPDLPYERLHSKFALYDLVYNPELTLFLQKGQAQGATTKNGLEMLYLQAEKAWDIWSSTD
ncbi:shikimate dehydrogenase family protein [Eisenibacter elegans]|jgi:shikimate dehydrogenase|uniref:shikimate dehydrogenase family protein n=1 Tax=Eisenibacter elegans TaxID=997 RepID=UPI00041ECF17|nr:shikimate dehydrogenase [Eisenibacter elegans]